MKDLLHKHFAKVLCVIVVCIVALVCANMAFKWYVHSFRDKPETVEITVQASGIGELVDWNDAEDMKVLLDAAEDREIPVQNPKVEKNSDRLCYSFEIAREDQDKGWYIMQFAPLREIRTSADELESLINVEAIVFQVMSNRSYKLDLKLDFEKAEKALAGHGTASTTEEMSNGAIVQEECNVSMEDHSISFSVGP